MFTALDNQSKKKKIALSRMYQLEQEHNHNLTLLNKGNKTGKYLGFPKTYIKMNC